MDSLRRMLGKSMLLIDGGNLHSIKKDAEVDRDAGFIIEIMNQQNYDVGVLGPKDFLLPDSSRRKLLDAASFDWVGSNYLPGERPAGVSESWIQKIDGVKVGVFSFVDPSWNTNSVTEEQVLDNLEQVAGQLRKTCDVVVLVAHSSSREPENLAKRVDGLVDVMLLGGVTTPWTKPRVEGGVNIGNSGDRGRQIARFDLLLNREKAIVAADYSLVKLEHDVPRDPVVAQRMLDFAEEQQLIKRAELEQARLAKLAEIGMKAADMPGADSPHRYVGEKECRECHQQIYAAWRTTQHGRAFSDLIRARESHLDEKVRRTTTGWMESSGYVDRRQSSHLYNVQCESCHGRGSAHVDSKGEMLDTLIDPATTCAGCHDSQQDPDFDLHAGLAMAHDISDVPAAKSAQPSSTRPGFSPLGEKRKAVQTTTPKLKTGNGR